MKYFALIYLLSYLTVSCQHAPTISSECGDEDTSILRDAFDRLMREGFDSCIFSLKINGSITDIKNINYKGFEQENALSEKVALKVDIDHVTIKGKINIHLHAKDRLIIYEYVTSEGEFSYRAREEWNFDRF